MGARKVVKNMVNAKTMFLGQYVHRYNYGHEIRAELERLCRKGELPPKEYWEALSITWEGMSKYEKDLEGRVLDLEV